MMSKKFREVSISFGNMMTMDRNGFREVIMVKAISRYSSVDEEVVGDKNPDLVSLDQSFEIYC